MIYVSSDWHGCKLEKIEKLLEKAGFGEDDFLFVLGDVIDRGYDGVELLKWLMLQPNAELILGNHEAMLLANSWLFEEITEDSVNDVDMTKMRRLSHWQQNGAEPTIKGLRGESAEMRADIIEYLREECPLYEKINVGGKEFWLLHAGLGNFSEDKDIEDYTDHDILWERPSIYTEYSKRFTTVLGHTPTCYYGSNYRGRILKTDTFINIDAGSACGFDPCILRLNDMKEFYLDI